MAITQEKADKMKVGEYWDSWHRFQCPYCEKLNWLCNGNEQDLSAIDVEACKCWNCDKSFKLGPEDAIMDEIRGDGDLYEQDGKEKP